MSEPLGRLRRFLAELKRRKVYQVTVAYIVVAAGAVQLVDVVVPDSRLPDWSDAFFLGLVVFGFPIALVLAWAFEVTPEGVRRTSSVKGPADEPSADRFALTALGGLGLLAAVAIGGWYLLGDGGGSKEPRAGGRSIAVLPFEALGQAEPDVFTEGMHDDLLARLSNVSDLKVISRTSVRQYRDTRKTTAEIARELGVRWILEGGVQQMGDQIQVNAQLIDPSSDTHAWADSYRRDLTAVNLFDLQSEITKRIARSLEAELTSEETERVERRPTTDLGAYKLYVRGRTRLNTRTEEGWRDAVDYFQRAIEQDPSYALAWSGLADAVGLQTQHSPEAVPPTLPNHEQAARRALEFDPELAEAHASMGFYHFKQRNGPAALRELQRAVELKPSYAQAHHWLGLLFMHFGRVEKARENLALAVELNPEHASARNVYIQALAADSAFKKAQEHLREHPQGPPSNLKRQLLYHSGQWDELRQAGQDALKTGDGETNDWHFWLGMVAAAQRDARGAREHLAWIRKHDPSDRRYSQEALIHAALGEHDAAFAAWRKMEEWGAWWVFPLRYQHPEVLGPFRDDPRYRELIRTLNQDWGLNPDGSLPEEPRR